MDNIEAEAFNILITGSFSEMEKLDPEIATLQAIELLTSVAENNPKVLLKFIREAVEVKIDEMVIVALAILTAKANEAFLMNKKNSGTILSILSIYGPPKLLEYTEYLKSKVFGRGLGARPQKWVRAVMEGWNIITINNYLSQHTMDFYSLIRLVHPRYQGNRGSLIKEVLDLKKTE